MVGQWSTGLRKEEHHVRRHTPRCHAALPHAAGGEREGPARRAATLERRSRGGDPVPLASGIDARLRHEQYLAREDDAPVPIALPLDAPPWATKRGVRSRLVPAPTLRAFDRDIEAAGIAKKDEWDRTVDFHSLRHTS